MRQHGFSTCLWKERKEGRISGLELDRCWKAWGGGKGKGEHRLKFFQGIELEGGEA